MGDFLSDPNELQVLRRELNQSPELSGKEFDTSAKIVYFLKQYPPCMGFLDY